MRRMPLRLLAGAVMALLSTGSLLAQETPPPSGGLSPFIARPRARVEAGPPAVSPGDNAPRPAFESPGVIRREGMSAARSAELKKTLQRRKDHRDRIRGTAARGQARVQKMREDEMRIQAALAAELARIQSAQMSEAARLAAIRRAQEIQADQLRMLNGPPVGLFPGGGSLQTSATGKLNVSIGQPYIVGADGWTYTLDFGTRSDLLAVARQLNGQNVIATGTTGAASGIGIPERRTLFITGLAPLPAGGMLPGGIGTNPLSNLNSPLISGGAPLILPPGGVTLPPARIVP